MSKGAIDQKRLDKMFSLNLKYDGQQFTFHDINFHWTDLLCMTDEEFDKAYTRAKNRKLEIEKSMGDMATMNKDLNTAWDQTDQKDLPMAEFNELCNTLYELELNKETLADQVKKLNVKILDQKGKILAVLDQYNLPNFRNENALFYQAERSTVKVIDKSQVYNFLKSQTYLDDEGNERNYFDSLATVNSQTLGRFVKEQKKILEEQDIYEYEVPGLEIGSLIELRLKDKKKKGE